MNYVFDIALELARVLMNVWDGVATSGSSTAVIDSNMPQGAGYFTNGTVWALTTGHTGYTGRGQRITNWNATLHQIMVQTTIKTPGGSVHNVENGDTYSAAPGDYPLYVLINSLNHAIQKFGSLPNNFSTLSTVKDQDNYIVDEVGMAYSPPVKVEIARSLTYPYDYVENRQWRLYSDGGDTYLKFDHAPEESGYKIRVWFNEEQTPFANLDGQLSELLHPERLVKEAAPYAIMWRIQQVEGDEPILTNLYNEAVEAAAKSRADFPIPKVDRNPRLANW